MKKFLTLVAVAGTVAYVVVHRSRTANKAYGPNEIKRDMMHMGGHTDTGHNDAFVLITGTSLPLVRALHPYRVENIPSYFPEKWSKS